MNKRLKVQPLATTAAFIATIEMIAFDDRDLRAGVARYNKAIAKLKSECAAATAETVLRIKANLALAEAYAEEHKGELFPGDRKSGETANGKFGFRKSPGVLKQLSKKWKPEDSIAALKDNGRSDLIETKESLRKDVIKDEFQDDAPALAAFGLRVEESDKFWVEPKTEINPSAQLTA